MISNKQSAASIAIDVAAAFKPTIKRSVSDAAAEYVRLIMPGGYSGPFDKNLTPYLVEPMDTLGSRMHEAVVFVGPAQSGKTEALMLGWLGWIITCCFADTLIVEKSFDSARDFSRRRIDRMIRNSPKLKEQLSTRRHDDNTYDKFFKNGMILSMGWPAINSLSGRPLRFCGITDYDRIPPDIEGNGDAFGLTRKRNTTFMSGGMTAVESSPGDEILTPDGKPAINWRPSTPHEAPPSPGIISLFNRGDRRCWYWTCPHCHEVLRPLFSLLSYPDAGPLRKRASQVILPCPTCGSVITHEEKRALNLTGKWLAEWEVLGETSGSSNIASFWMEGPAAAFQSWESLVLRYLQAEEEFSRTGDEIPLRSTVNTDQGRPYLSRRITASRDTASLLDRADPDLPRGIVPYGVRFLVATVDVQATRFVVQVMGIGVGREWWLIDRFDIAMSGRKIGEEPQAVEPAIYGEDWDLQTSRVLSATYPLGDDSGRVMRIRLTGCDSAGQPGVTERAYEYWRRLKRENLHNKFQLVKGESKISQRVRMTYPDATHRNDRKANARGDVPVLALNSNAIKDALHADLQRPQPGPGYIHLPQWLPASIWDELTAETRMRGGWEKVSARNEMWDLLCYSLALLIHLGSDTWGEGWQKCPPWARAWDENPLVVFPTSALTQPQSLTPAPTKTQPRQPTPWVNREENRPWIR